MVKQDKHNGQQIAELMKKIGPLKEPPADMEKRVKASVREAWVEQFVPSMPHQGYRPGFGSVNGINKLRNAAGGIAPGALIGPLIAPRSIVHTCES